MKKLFTLALTMLILGGIQTNAQLRRTWDFTKGFSASTIENLKAVGWTDETANRSIQCGARSEGELTYTLNGSEWTVPETSGLIIGITEAKHLVFAYDYNNSGFKGSKFLWINGSNKKKHDWITIPAIPAGETVAITYESHSTTQDRGFKVSGDFSDADGNQTFTSKGDTVTVYIQNKGNETADLTLTATNGHHIYKIVVGEGDIVKNKEVAFLYKGSYTEPLVSALQAREQTDVKLIDITTATPTADELKAYDLVVLSAGVYDSQDLTAVLKEVLPFVPMLNVDPDLYSQWGYGSPVLETLPLGEVKMPKSPLLKDIEPQAEDGVTFVQIAEEPAIAGVNLGEYFQDDDVVLGIVGQSEEDHGAMAHVHSIDHNGYIYLPFYNCSTLTESGIQLFNNAVDMLFESKAEIAPAPAPAIAMEYKDHQTNITLTASKQLRDARIYYTLDGTDPTEESNLYTDVITVTEPCTIKASAIGEGYLLSKPNTQEVEIMEQPAQPVVAIEKADGQSTVTLTCETPEVEIYYNLTGEPIVAQSSLYTEPIVFDLPTTIYAFSLAKGIVASEVTTSKIEVSHPFIAIDVVAHFATPVWDGIGNNGSLFSDNLNATSSMYDTTQESITTYDPESGDEITTYPEVEWMIKDEAGETPQWDIRSKGQVVLFQNNTPTKANFGDDNDVNPERVIDVDSIFQATKNNIHFYKCYSGEPANAAIQSKNAYAGPFNVAVITCMNGNPLVVEVSTDSINWEQIGKLEVSSTKSRAWRKVVFKYEGTDEVYVRVDQKGGTSTGPKVYDIYIANQGEKSQALAEQLAQGVEVVRQDTTTASAGIYTLNGVRVSKLQRGLNIVVSNNGTVKKVLVK